MQSSLLFPSSDVLCNGRAMVEGKFKAQILVITSVCIPNHSVTWKMTRYRRNEEFAESQLSNEYGFCKFIASYYKKLMHAHRYLPVKVCLVGLFDGGKSVFNRLVIKQLRIHFRNLCLLLIKRLYLLHKWFKIVRDGLCLCLDWEKTHFAVQ